MHDLELARLIHADREREIARELRVRAFRIAQKEGGEAFVPPAGERPAAIAGTPKLMPSERRGT